MLFDDARVVRAVRGRTFSADAPRQPREGLPEQLEVTWIGGVGGGEDRVTRREERRIDGRELEARDEVALHARLRLVEPVLAKERARSTP